MAIDPPDVAFGYAPPVCEGKYDPLNDPDCITPDQVYDNFQVWVTSYFEHPNIASGTPSGLSYEKRPSKRTISTWTEEEMAKYCDKRAAIRGDFSASVTLNLQRIIYINGAS